MRMRRALVFMGAEGFREQTAALHVDVVGAVQEDPAQAVYPGKR